MNILIIEDEPLVAVSLSRLVKELEPEAVLYGPVASVEESKAWLQSHPAPDLILSDIQLSDGISLDVFADRSIDCPIIFTTAYNEYAIRAFKVNSIDYLLKPIEKTELENAFQKFHQLQDKFHNAVYVESVQKLFGNFAQSNKYKERFAVHIGRAVSLVPQQEVIGFAKEEVIYLLNNEAKKFITDYRSLDEVQELLDPRLFFRANRQFIIQLSFIESFRTDESGKLHLRIKGNKLEELIISKEKAAEFRKWFDA
jgi:two-component system, LytTR family, response regulator